MAKVKLRYLGDRKRKRLHLPCPFLSMSALEGEVTFTGQGDVQAVEEQYVPGILGAAPDLFEVVSDGDGEKRGRKKKDEPSESES